MQPLKPFILKLVELIDDFRLLREARKRRRHETVAVTIEELKLSIEHQPSNSAGEVGGHHHPN